MFQKHVIQFENRNDRRVFRHAHIPNRKFNAALGPPGDYFPVGAPPCSSRLLSFMHEMMPGEWQDQTKMHYSVRGLVSHCLFRLCGIRAERNIPPMKVPVDVYQCVLKGVHCHPEVLIAMAE